MVNVGEKNREWVGNVRRYTSVRVLVGGTELTRKTDFDAVYFIDHTHGRDYKSDGASAIGVYYYCIRGIGAYDGCWAWMQYEIYASGGTPQALNNLLDIECRYVSGQLGS